MTWHLKRMKGIGQHRYLGGPPIPSQQVFGCRGGIVIYIFSSFLSMTLELAWILSPQIFAVWTQHSAKFPTSPDEIWLSWSKKVPPLKSLKSTMNESMYFVLEMMDFSGRVNLVPIDVRDWHWCIFSMIGIGIPGATGSGIPRFLLMTPLPFSDVQCRHVCWNSLKHDQMLVFKEKTFIFSQWSSVHLDRRCFLWKS